MTDDANFTGFEMPSAREIELDLALASPSWQSLLAPHVDPAGGSHAIVLGGSMAGLLAARALADHFDQVTIVDRDRLPVDARYRDGVPQSRHVHGLLRRGLIELEGLYPGLETELVDAGAVPLSGPDFLRLSAFGWAERFETPGLIAASRELIEWSVRRRTLADQRITVLDGHEVEGLIASSGGSIVNGVELRDRISGAGCVLLGDLVVDATGRNSKAPAWLRDLGYGEAPETVINSFVGYASCVYRIPPGFAADWKILMVGDKPPVMGRAGIVAPIEGGRWMVGLAGYGRDYPPTDREGFLAFARSLRSELLYRAIRDAEALTRISGFRATVNRRRHFESMARWPERFIVLGDAACTFNPVYGQGMSVAAMTAAELRRAAGDFARPGFARRMQKRVAKTSLNAWVIATGADVRYPTTEGRQPGSLDRLMQRYIDRVIEVSMQDAEVNAAFSRVVHLLDAPQALLSPAVARRVFAGRPRPLLEPPLARAVLRPART